ncbi:MAG: single-stranded-DNA-specific exonuclease RecJ [Patescibacteria group bacterium]
MQNWILKEALREEEEKGLASYSGLLRHLLFHRGIKDEVMAEKFLNPNYETDFHDPFLILNMKKAVERILSAISSGEKIVVYGDYDCDGIPGSAILNDFFRKIKYENFYVYIPHRHKEGYGLNIPAIEKFGADNVKLLITVDNGITNVAEVDRANELGIDVIITDHHLPQEKVPKAFAILNSKQVEDNYPYDMLCGAGVAFKLVQALLREAGEKFGVKPGWGKWLLDLVGISTIADMVPLTGENRVLAYYGLKVLKRTPRPGLLKLFRKAGIRSELLTEEDVGFTIAPRINAASRMGVPIKGFEMLSSTDETEAGLLADYLEEKNNERKKAVVKMMKEVDKMMETDKGSAVIVVGHESWAPGVVGLAASKIVDKYDRPAFVWVNGVEDDPPAGEAGIKGSCRSDGRVNLVDLMVSIGEDSFLALGGHALAGGFSVSENKLGELSKKLSEAYMKLRTETKGEKDEPVLIDKEISIDEVNQDTYGLIEKLAPFGIENHRPVFLISNLEIYRVSYFGADKQHLKLEFENSSGSIISAITFYHKEKDFGKMKLEAGQKIDIIFTIENSTFGWKNELRMRIVGLR